MNNPEITQAIYLGTLDTVSATVSDNYKETIIEQLQRELAIDKVDAHKWRTYTMHKDGAAFVESINKLERELAAAEEVINRLEMMQL